MINTIFHYSCKYCIFLILCSLYLLPEAYSQTKITGILYDSVANRVLESASVSVFQSGKNTVYKITLTDRYGKFVIDDVYSDQQLQLEVSHLNYQKFNYAFSLQKNEKRDFGKLKMTFLENTLETVEVIPPVRMNGDTLEFNADSFELDSNAVVEDLIRKLPGLVIWGDGELTYQGKTIPSVLVNGKKFFGDDMQIALQNIDKKALKTVQIYDIRTKEEKQHNPSDKKLEMNLVLKEGKEDLYFGSVSAGIGTNERKQALVNFNKSTAKMQATLAYGAHNVNKSINSVNDILRLSTFKGIGINADYESDFLRRGISSQQVLGGRLQYDYLGSKDVYKKKLFTADYSSNWNTNKNTDDSYTQYLSEDKVDNNFRSSYSKSTNELQTQQAHLVYENNVFKFRKRDASINSKLNYSANNNRSYYENNSEMQFVNNNSSNYLLSENHIKGQNLGVSTNIGLGRKQVQNNKMPTFWESLTYQMNVNAGIAKNEGTKSSSSDYKNEDNPDLNRKKNRLYELESDNYYINMLLKASSTNNLLNWEIYANYDKGNNLQATNDVLNKQSTTNTDLSFIASRSNKTIKPSVQIQKQLFSRNYYSRSQENLNTYAKAGVQVYREDNQSSLAYRNEDLHYTSFLPELGLTYYKIMFSDYYFQTQLTYKYREEYPTLDRIRPIYDDLNPSFRDYGSTYALEATGVHELSLNGNYDQTRNKGYSFNYNFSYQLYKQGLSDSIVFTADQQQNYTIQIDEGMSNYSAYVSVRKPFSITKNQTFTVALNLRNSFGNKFQYYDNMLQEMQNNSQNVTADLYYSFGNKYHVGWNNSVNRYARSDKQSTATNNNYTNYSWKSTMSMAYMLTKKWSVNSNVVRVYNKSHNYRNDVFIWNAHSSYRMMKGNNLEIKVSAYDLLRQNKGVNFYNGLTEFTRSTSNILTQYYMLSLSYYPRKFGAKR